MTKDMSWGGRVRGVSEPQGQQYEKLGKDLNHMTSDKLREGRSPWEPGPIPVLLIAKYPGLSALVTSSTWPIVPTLLMPV